MKVSVIVVSLAMVLALSIAGTAAVINPIAMDISCVGGTALNQYTPGVTGGVGVNNIGLLIKTWGSVTYVDSANKYFYINDGSNRVDGSQHFGIRVSYDNLAAGVSITAPNVGDYVAVTGISSTVLVNNLVQSNLRPRRQGDIQTVYTKPV